MTEGEQGEETNPNLSRDAEILSSLVGKSHSRKVQVFRNVPRSELRKKNVDASDKTREYKRDLENEELKKKRQANRHREFLFWFCTIIVTLSIATSAVIAIWGTFQGSELETAPTVAFISGLSVQTLGVLWVIAKYLFAPPIEATSTGDGSK